MPENTFQQALRQRFAEFTPHVAECGMCITRIDREAAEITLPYRDDWLGDAERGLLHPGIVTTLVDSASGLAVLARVGQLEPIATLDLRMDYLRAGLRDLDVHC
ncbi:MAG: PaaI family thioesterase, partial [Gammaproteobacteria bacterium]